MRNLKYFKTRPLMPLALAAALTTAVAVGSEEPAASAMADNPATDLGKKPLDQQTHAAELVENPDFEVDRLVGWSLVPERSTGGEMVLDTALPYDESNPHSLRITVKAPGGRCTVRNAGTSEMKFDSGRWYDLTFYARTDNNRHFGLVVSLESEDGQKVCGRATVPEVGGGWAKYTLALHTHQSAPKGRLVISVFDPGTIWLDFVSLSPRETSH